jgi:positive regulator of sigma E activity
MKNIAYVKEISGGNAVLRIKRECMCGGKEKCGAKCFALADDMLEAVIYNNIGAEAGDYVEIEGNTRAVLIYAALLFIMPVFTGIFLYFIINFYIGGAVMPYVVSGAACALNIFAGLYFLNKTAAKRKSSDFKITKIINMSGDN